MSILFSIKAGRAFRREGSNFIDADLAKGSLVLESGSDGLLYLRWRTRDGSVSTREDLELVIFPSDASFERISDDPSVRMYILKFHSSDQLHFFWLQDPDSSQDASNVEKINKIMSEYDMDSAADEGISENTTVTSGPSSNNPPQTAPAGPLNPEQLNSVVQEILRNLQGRSRAGVAPDVALSDILTPSILAPLLQDPRVVDSLAQFLPTDLPSSQEMSMQEMLKQTVASAPFRASVRSLDQALSTGLLGGLVANLGMPMEAGLGIHPFLEAVKTQAAEPDESVKGSGQNDEKMDTE